MLKALSRSLVSVVFPSSCNACGASLPLAGEAGLCAACERSVPLLPAAHRPLEAFHFDGLIAACAYDNAMKKLLKSFKFGRERALTACLLGFMRRALERDGFQGRWDGVTPVPMHAQRRIERGFNQSELLAKGIAQTVEAPFIRALSLKANPRVQSGLDKTQRRDNVKDLFRLADGARPAGLRVLLVDDILTTGQTASACAKVLKDSGAASVDVLVAARTL